MKPITVDRETQINRTAILEPGDQIIVESKRNTYTSHKSGGNIVVTYQGTNVVTFNDKTIILDPNGWWTKTTKRRMNQASEEYDLGYWVYQKTGQWYVDYKGKTHRFESGVVVLDR